MMYVKQLLSFILESSHAQASHKSNSLAKGKLLAAWCLFVMGWCFAPASYAAKDLYSSYGSIAPLNANLPASIYNAAVSESVVMDFDYLSLDKGFAISKIRSIINKALPRPPKGLVDKVVVNKSHHQMLLYKNQKLVRKYWIALSDRPVGDKVQQGDRRTPEGTYTLDYVKENSYYYRAFHISYPNAEDIAQARKLGVNPGGLIMVHGQPPSNSEYYESVQRSDWTNGCIAILNHEMDDFINLVDPGTPIQINP